MATTGFWPVKGRLKEVLAYAKNPDKTTEAKYLDDDLRSAIDYAENSSKTDEQMYVSGINCSKHRAYEEMCAVKQKFGERGKVIAYHGYQSFEAGEVTPEEAHEIGEETARRMWGDRFQVLVTTHLNTDMRVICTTAGMPPSMIPRQSLKYSSVISINESMHTGFIVRSLIPVLNKNGCTRLSAPYGMKHKPLYCYFPPRRIARIICHNGFNQLHFSHPPVSLHKRPTR